MRLDSKEASSVRVCLLVVVLLATSCASSSVEVGSALTPAQLNSTRGVYHEKRVRVRGWMRSEFENYALWQSKNANTRGSFAANCISLMIPKSLDASRYNKRYVEVEGVFLQKLPSNVVHLGGCNVTTLQLLEDVPPVIIEN